MSWLSTSGLLIRQRLSLRWFEVRGLRFETSAGFVVLQQTHGVIDCPYLSRLPSQTYRIAGGAYDTTLNLPKSPLLDMLVIEFVTQARVVGEEFEGEGGKSSEFWVLSAEFSTIRQEGTA
jgi:hypothetical protein